MAEEIDGLFVKLGLNVDGEQFKQGVQAFQGITRAALGFVGVTAAGVGFDAITRGAAQATDKLGKFGQTYGVAAKDIQNLGIVLEHAGGNFDDVFGSIENVVGILDGMRRGDFNEDAMLFGFDYSQLQGVESAGQALSVIADQYERIRRNDPQQARRMAEALGLTPAMQRAMEGGSGTLQAQLQRAQDQNEISDNLVQTSAEFNDAMTDFTNTLGGVTNLISEQLLPELTKTIQGVTGFMAENKLAIADFIGRGPESLVDTINEKLGLSKPLLDVGGFLNLGEGSQDDPWWHLFRQRDTSERKDSPKAAPPVEQQALPPPQMRDDREQEIAEKAAVTDRELGLPPGATLAQLTIESGLKTDAVSQAGAEGLAQIMPKTREEFSRRAGRDLDPFDVDDAILMNKMAMQENIKKFGNYEDALRAYNGGWKPSKWDNKETREYVPKIAAERERINARETLSRRADEESPAPMVVAETPKRETGEIGDQKGGEESLLERFSRPILSAVDAGRQRVEQVIEAREAMNPRPAQNDEGGNLLLDAFRAGQDRISELTQARATRDAERFAPRMQQQAQNIRSEQVINVDARGSGDPVAVEAAARRGVTASLGELAERGMQSMPTPLK